MKSTRTVKGLLNGEQVEFTILGLARHTGVTEYFVRNRLYRMGLTDQAVLDACSGSADKKVEAVSMANKFNRRRLV